jgi:hypothetical protein
MASPRRFRGLGTRSTAYHPPSTCNRVQEGWPASWAIEFGEIHAQTIEKNGLNVLALIEQHRGGELHGSVHRKIGVGDDFQARSGFGDGFFGPLVATHASFICGRAEILETPLSVKVSASALLTKLLRGVPSWRSRENFIHDQRQFVVAAEGVERRGLRAET